MIESCKTGHCVVVFTQADGEKDAQIMSLDDAMQVKFACEEGATLADKVEVFLKVAESLPRWAPAASETETLAN
jgi:hypothetical protein